jgi:CubicO group peptidase (beta-lactamase class C family)
MTDDTIFRLASMTKAITGVAVMILYEEGHFRLNDPVSKFIPSFKNARVQVGGVPVPGKADKLKDKKDWSQADLDQWLKENWDTLTDEEKKKWTDYYAAKGKGKDSSTESLEDVETVPVDRPITIRDLLRHTAGISYAMGDIWAEGDDLGQMIDKLAAQPLKSQLGTRFEYGLSMDVLARLVEVVSGQSFDEFIQERIFDPLEMNDAGFQVPMDQAARLVIMPTDEKSTKKDGTSSSEDPYLSPPVVLMGGTGLVSTTMDYLRFCQMLLNNGELEGKRILGRKAVELMHADHMNDVADRSSGSKTGGDFHFGLTFGIDGKPGDRGELGSEGVYWWGGAYGTTFWIDPNENLVGVFMVNGVKYDEEQSI